MARPKIEWTDTQLRAIIIALAKLDRDFPLDNARFLNGLIDEVGTVTGRLYGATTYTRLLRDVATGLGVERHPSSATIQKAVSRAESLAPSAPAVANESATIDVHACVGFGRYEGHPSRNKVVDCDISRSNCPPHSSV